MKKLYDTLPFIIVGFIVLLLILLTMFLQSKYYAFSRASRFIEANQPDKAIELLEPYTEVLNVKEKTALIFAYRENGQVQKSTQLMYELLKQEDVENDVKAGFYMELADSYYRVEDYSMALENYLNCISLIEPLSEDYWELKYKIVNTISNDLSEANVELGISTIEEIIQEKGATSELQEILCSFYMQKGDYSKADNLINSALLTDFNNDNLLLMKAKSLLKKGELENATDTVKQALRVSPKNYEGHYLMGVIYEVKEDYFTAIKSYQTAILCNPLDLQSRLSIAYIYLNQGNKTAAISELNELVKKSPNSKEGLIASELIKELAPSLW